MIKNIIILLLFVIFSTGCATYPYYPVYVGNQYDVTQARNYQQHQQIKRKLQDIEDNQTIDYMQNYMQNYTNNL